MPSASSESSGSHRPPFCRGTDAVATVAGRLQVLPASLDDQAKMLIGCAAVSPPTDAAHRSVPAARLPSACGSSYSVAQQSPALVIGSSMCPTSVNDNPSSLECRIVPPMRPLGSGVTTDATTRPACAPTARRITRG